MKRRALVLGGAGFIGYHLLQALRDCGEYDLLVSGDVRAPGLSVDGVEYKAVDVRVPLPRDLCPGVTEIYNLAAVHTTPGHEDWEYFWTNVLGATHVCAYASQVGCNTILFASSISVYGATECPKDETSALEPDSAYGRSKACAEAVHRQWLREHPERRLVTVRPAVVYGYRESGNFTRLARALSKGAFFFPGRKDTIKASGYVKDLVRSMRFALARSEREIIYNFAQPAPHTIEQICDAFASVAGYARPRMVIPLWLMLAGARCFEWLNAVGLRNSINRPRIYKLNRSTNVVPDVLQQLGFDFTYDLRRSLQSWKAESGDTGFE